MNPTLTVVLSAISTLLNSTAGQALSAEMVKLIDAMIQHAIDTHAAGK